MISSGSAEENGLNKGLSSERSNGRRGSPEKMPFGCDTWTEDEKCHKSLNREEKHPLHSRMTASVFVSIAPHLPIKPADLKSVR